MSETISLEEYKKLGNKKLKYRNKKVKWQGKTFDSRKELNFYIKLSDDKKSGKIRDFKWQFPLKFMLNDKKIFTLNLDFVVERFYKEFEYIDIKGLDKKTGKFLTTSIFNLKKKIIEIQYGITIILK